jgi:EmrB/QacA subfamily drug resistance transporter
MTTTDRPHPTRSLLILSVAAMAFALGQTTLIPAFPELIDALDTDAAGAAWTLTGYLVSAAVFTPIMGRLGDMFGKRRMLVLSLGAFVLGSIVSALGSSLEVVVAGRVLQGVGGGVFPLCFGIVRDEFPPERVGRSIGLMSAIAAIGGGLGLIVGGLLVDHASYHWIFWLGAAMGALAIVSTQLLIPESPIRTPGRVDVRGALILAVGLVAPLIAITQANDWGWTAPRTVGLLAFGLIVLAVWVWVEKRTAEPLADISVLVRPPVLMTNLATLLVGFGMFGAFTLTPQIVQAPESTGYGFGLEATDTGLLMLPGALGMLVLGPVSGIVGSRVGHKVPLAAGGLVTALGLLLIGLDHSSEAAVLVYTFVMSAGIGLAFAAMPNLIVSAVPRAQTGEATGFNALVRSVGSSLGSQVTAAIVAGSVVASTGLPSDDGFTTAYLACAGFAAVTAVVALLIPRAAHAPHEPAASEVGAAAPLGDPAHADERF